MLMAPIGVTGIVHPDGELAAARAAKTTGVPYIMSTAASRSIEDVAEANGNGQRWFQLYWYVPSSFPITCPIYNIIPFPINALHIYVMSI
jgi:isopentenyl diphosphate isomerase/L-lactate dehydrogenase-like FMN-dependent dehydrogenase